VLWNRSRHHLLSTRDHLLSAHEGKTLQQLWRQILAVALTTVSRMTSFVATTTIAMTIESVTSQSTINIVTEMMLLCAQ